MNDEIFVAVRAMLRAAGVRPEAAEAAMRIAAGGTVVSTTEACATLKTTRWTLSKFCVEHGIERDVRAHRGGSLINARQLYEAWERVHG